jgi:hypothetical protein
MGNNVAASVGQTVRRLYPIGKLFRDAWREYKSKFSTLAKIILVPAVIVALGNALLSQHGTVAVVGSLIYFVGCIVLIFASIALLFAIIAGTDFAESYRRSPGIFWSFVWVSVLGGVATLGGFVMLIVPGILMGIWFLFSRYLVIAENRRGLNALMQSREYARGYWWAIFGRMLLVSIMVGIIAAAASAILISIFGAALGSVVNVFVWVFVVPFPVVYIYLVYKNLTMLKPELATAQPNANRKFLVASGIVGIIGIVLIPILLIGLIGFALTHQRGMSNNPPGTLGAPSNTASGTPGY